MRISADFYLFMPVFYVSKTPLNINQYLILTNPARPKVRVSRVFSICYDHLHLFKTFLLYCFKIEKHPSGLQNRPICAPGALICRRSGAHSQPAAEPTGKGASMKHPREWMEARPGGVPRARFTTVAASPIAAAIEKVSHLKRPFAGWRGTG
jgi:hypothetical protein